MSNCPPKVIVNDRPDAVATVVVKDPLPKIIVLKSEPLTNTIIIKQPQPKVTLIEEKEQHNIAVVQQVLRGERGANADGVYYREIFTPQQGQTIFNLQKTVNNPEMITLYLNGQKETYGESFIVGNNDQILEWISFVILDSGDTLEAFYQYY